MISYLDAVERQTVETTQTKIASTTATYETDINFLVVKQITKPIPTRSIHTKFLSLPPHLELADPTFYKPQNRFTIRTIFWDILEADRIQLGTKQPLL